MSSPSQKFSCVRGVTVRAHLAVGASWPCRLQWRTSRSLWRRADQGWRPALAPLAGTAFALALPRCSRVLSNNLAHDSPVRGTLSLVPPHLPGVPDDIFISRTLLLRHPQQSYEGGAKLWRGAVYRSTTRVSSRLPKTLARRLAADLFSRRNARAGAHSSFGFFKGYLSWTFRRADTFRTFVSTDPCHEWTLSRRHPP